VSGEEHAVLERIAEVEGITVSGAMSLAFNEAAVKRGISDLCNVKTEIFTSDPKPPKVFTPIFDTVVQKHGLITAAVYGVLWRECSDDREDGGKGQCSKSLEELSDFLMVSRKTVERHIAILVDVGYIECLDPDTRNKPHIYRVNGPYSSL
jgi:hypothetical protein